MEELLQEDGWLMENVKIQALAGNSNLLFFLDLLPKIKTFGSNF